MKHYAYTYGEITFTAYVHVFVDRFKGKNNLNLFYNIPKLFNTFGIIRDPLKPFASKCLGPFQLLQGHYLLFVALTAKHPESSGPFRQSDIIINFLTIFVPRTKLVNVLTMDLQTKKVSENVFWDLQIVLIELYSHYW